MKLEEIQSLSDADLVSLLRQNGANVGPLTGTTRGLFEKKLFRLVNKEALEVETTEKQEKDVSDPCQNPVDANSKTSDEQAKGAGSGDLLKAPLIPPASGAAGDSAAVGTAAGPLVYFAVQIPVELRTDEDNCIFVDRQEALKMVKKHPGSRFKLFNSKEQAKKFSVQPPDVIPPSPKPAEPLSKDNVKAVSDSSGFRGPKPPELSQFRKNVESGDLAMVKEKIWTNPRFLISSGDTPTVLQENFRYNALHTCAMKNQASAAKLILDTIQDEAFLRLMYPDDSQSTRQERIAFLTDLYLNMPDKGLNETPLHFACKFGHHEVVKVLTSQPLTDKFRANKYGDTPKSIACQRMRNGAANAKQIIHSYLEEQCYVPLLRSLDESAPASVVAPMSSQSLADVLQTGTDSPHHSPRTVKALAGPMSPVQADRFRRTWTTPPSPSVTERKRYAEIRRSDCTKGLERIGRSLAHNLHIPWSEYWDFLGTFTDLSTSEGLKQFEGHLQEKYNELSKELELKSDLDTIGDLFSGLRLGLGASTSHDNTGAVDANDSKCQGRFELGKNSTTGLKTDDTDVRDLAAIFGGKSRSEIKTKTATVPENYTLVCDSKSKHTGRESESDSENKSQAKSEDSVDEIDKLCGSFSVSCKTSQFELDSEKENEKPTEKQHDVSLKRLEQGTQAKQGSNAQKNDSLPSLKETNAFSERPALLNRENSQGCLNTNIEKIKVYDRQHSDGGDTYHTALDSASEPHSEASDLEEFEDCFDSPDGALSRLQPDRLFIYGKEPCKVDIDVLRAIGEIPVSPVQHPHVFQWKNSVLSVSEETRNRWSVTPTRGRHSNPSTPTAIRYPHTPQSVASSSFLDATLLDEDEPISFHVRDSPSDSDSSLSSRDESLLSIRTNLISDFFLQQQ